MLKATLCLQGTPRNRAQVSLGISEAQFLPFGGEAAFCLIYLCFEPCSTPHPPSCYSPWEENEEGPQTMGVQGWPHGPCRLIFFNSFILNQMILFVCNAPAQRRGGAQPHLGNQGAAALTAPFPPLQTTSRALSAWGPHVAAASTHTHTHPGQPCHPRNPTGSPIAFWE